MKTHHAALITVANGEKVTVLLEPFRDARNMLLACTDLVEAMQAGANVVLSAEAVEAEAKHVAEAMRAALAEVMVETGCPAVRIAYHTVSVVEPKPKLKVLDPKALPPSMMKPRPPEPDMEKIKAAIAEGAQLTGVAMVNGGAPYVTFRNRSE